MIPLKRDHTVGLEALRSVPSVVAGRAAQLPGFRVLAGARGIVTIHTDSVLQRRIAMNFVAIQASGRRTALEDVAHLKVHVAVRVVQGSVIRAFEVHLEVFKQIVAGNKVIGVGQARGLRAPAPQVTLPADRRNFTRLPRAFGRQHSLCRIGSVAELDVTVAGVAIESEGGKGMGCGVDTGGVATGALRGEDVGLPALAVPPEDGELAVADQLERAKVLRAADHVSALCRELRHAGWNTHGTDGPGVRLSLPGGAHYGSMAEQALVTRNVIRQRFAYVVVPGLILRAGLLRNLFLKRSSL